MPPPPPPPPPPKLFKCSQSGSEATCSQFEVPGQVLIGVFGKQSALHSALNSTCLYHIVASKYSHPITSFASDQNSI